MQCTGYQQGLQNQTQTMKFSCVHFWKKFQVARAKDIREVTKIYPVLPQVLKYTLEKSETVTIGTQTFF